MQVKDPVPIYSFNPLPFDDELKQQEHETQKEDIQEWYNRASAELANFSWPKSSNN